MYSSGVSLFYITPLSRCVGIQRPKLARKSESTQVFVLLTFDHILRKGPNEHEHSRNQQIVTAENSDLLPV